MEGRGKREGGKSSWTHINKKCDDVGNGSTVDHLSDGWHRRRDREAWVSERQRSGEQQQWRRLHVRGGRSPNVPYHPISMLVSLFQPRRWTTRSASQSVKEMKHMRKPSRSVGSWKFVIVRLLIERSTLASEPIRVGRSAPLLDTVLARSMRQANGPMLTSSASDAFVCFWNDRSDE